MHLHYSLIDAGHRLECFHATEDKQEVRDRVFERIAIMPDKFHVYTVIAEKSKAHPSLYQKWISKKGTKQIVKNEAPFYHLLSRTLLKYIFSSPRYAGMKRIVVVLSSIFTTEQRRAIEGTLKTYLSNFTSIPFTIFFKSNKADINCQLADYCGWAVFIKWERNENRSYVLIANRLRTEFDIFRLGDTHHYKSKGLNPKV